MNDSRRRDGTHPALVAAIGVIACSIFFPDLVVFIVGFVRPVRNPEAAAHAVQLAAFWLMAVLICVEYAHQRDRARVR